MFTKRWRGNRIQITEHKDDFGTETQDITYRLDDTSKGCRKGLLRGISDGVYKGMFFPREAYAVTLDYGDGDVVEEYRFANFANPDRFDPKVGHDGIYKEFYRDMIDLEPYWPNLKYWVIRDLHDFIDEPIKKRTGKGHIYRRPNLQQQKEYPIYTPRIARKKQRPKSRKS